MGLFKSKSPEIVQPPPPANAPTPANAAVDNPAASAGGGRRGTPTPAQSLISTSAQGLRRKASTQKTSLIGGV